MGFARVVFVGLLGFLCLGAASAQTHRYDVHIDRNLDYAFVKARLDGFVGSLGSDSGQPFRTLRSPRTCDGKKLRSRRGRLQVNLEDGCVQYSFRLKDGAPFGRRTYNPPPGVIITAPDDWLWLPRDEDIPVEVRMRVADGHKISAAWEDLGDHRYRFGKSPGSGKGLMMLGEFDYHELKVPGATLRIAIVPGVDNTKMLDWIEATATDVALVADAFPNPKPQVLVIPIPVSPKNEAVPFGRVVRDQGESVHFFVNAARPLSDFTGDWTATHEFSHLLLPYVHSDEKWISEGFASYYQNVLLGRAGVYSEQDAWRRLHRSFERAKETGGHMSPNGTAHEAFWEARMMIYWSGAAVALLADVELRKQGSSLDKVLGQLRDCCLPTDRIWKGKELFTKLDELSDTTVFMTLYDEYADNPGFPDVDQLYKDLGIRPVDNKQVTLTDRAEFVSIRKAIVGERPQAAEIRNQQSSVPN